tara:strand:+ start:86451 stop:88064 length:1614 start_codon:yes stop_codon:yes gene_type:complete
MRLIEHMANKIYGSKILKIPFRNIKYRQNYSKWHPFLWGVVVIGLLSVVSCEEKEKAKTAHALPNIVLILADDLGYGDLGSYNPNSLIPTPNLDRLASEGIRLTNAYCPVSVCSPSRYALMTGTYPFRSWKKSGVLSNYEPSMMAAGQLTLPKMLQQSGYTTAGFGKWHLGATFPTLDGEKPAGYGKFKAENNGANIDLKKPITDGPMDYGFDHWFGFSCASECWVMNGNNIVAALQHDFYNIEAATQKDHIEIIPSDEYLNMITKQSTRFLKERYSVKTDSPFFLYFAPYVPHIPLSVSDKFKGTTKAGLYGDYVYELDTYIGEILNTLDSLQQSQNTIVLFASDNGSQFEMTGNHIDLANASNSPKDVVKKGASPDEHHPNGDLRGTKWTIWEGGVRTPFLARWPGKFPSGAKSDQLFALNDVLTTLSSIVGFELPIDAAVDSYDQLAVLMGKEEGARESVIVQSSKNDIGIRKGNWKYIAPDNERREGQLYNLEEDRSESVNRYKEHPELVQSMKKELEEIISKKHTSTHKNIQ